jgi:hypothetical protein
MNPREIAPWCETRWLVLSSCLWLGPALYAAATGQPGYAAVLVATVAASVNHWRNARRGWARALDIAMARVAFGTFVITGVVYVTPTRKAPMAYAGLVAVIQCYIKSTTNHAAGKRDWWQYHAAFHLLMACEQWVILRELGGGYAPHLRL